MIKEYNQNTHYYATSFFSDGTIVPDLLTEQEAIKFLRLDDGGTKKPATTLGYYRSEGILKPTQVGKKLRYLRSELLNFLEEQTKRRNGDIS